mmetsp:Transcript_4207/g.9082  ORF Transcript_4207/g.9082 Transcript_4207/m.9082 type:complete len:119 (+) Transcript_4207:54-410(+)
MSSDVKATLNIATYKQCIGHAAYLHCSLTGHSVQWRKKKLKQPRLICPYSGRLKAQPHAGLAELLLFFEEPPGDGVPTESSHALRFFEPCCLENQLPSLYVFMRPEDSFHVKAARSSS